MTGQGLLPISRFSKTPMVKCPSKEIPEKVTEQQEFSPTALSHLMLSTASQMSERRFLHVDLSYKKDKLYFLEMFLGLSKSNRVETKAVLLMTLH